jgi:hypothetical protein
MVNMDSVKISSRLAKLLVDVIGGHVKDHTKLVLTEVAKDFDLSVDDLLQRYGNLAPNIELGRSKKKGANSVKSTEPKKRGRKKKMKEELIETEEYEYNGVTYLVDGDNNVYTYNIDQPTLIGTKLIDGRVKFLSTQGSNA